MKEIFDWLREQIKEEYNVLHLKEANGNKFDAIEIVDVESIINEAEAKWEATEAEIRNKVIDEFAERMKTICKKHQLGIDRKLLKPTYLNENGTWHSLIDDVVAQMKGEKE